MDNLQLRLQKKTIIQEERISELKEQNFYLRKQNLRMRLEMEVLMDHPDGKAAAKILHKYRLKRAIRQEAFLADQN